MKGTIGTLVISDWLKGLLVTVFTTLLTGIYAILAAGTFPTWAQFQPYLVSSIAAGIAYVLKNLGSNSDGQFLKKETPTE